jgi:hypothetical protein
VAGDVGDFDDRAGLDEAGFPRSAAGMEGGGELDPRYLNCSSQMTARYTVCHSDVFEFASRKNCV